MSSHKRTAQEIRKSIIQMIAATKSSHVGSCFSITDIVTVLFSSLLRYDPTNPKKADRDIFLLSKGHAAVALYATLAQFGFFPKERLLEYATDGSLLAGHVIKDALPGIEATAGSLGHGLSMAAGFAMANKDNDRRLYCLVGDGECNEGSVWEAALFAAHNKLKNLTVIVDVNKQQGLGNTSDILNMDTMAERWQAFGWEAEVVDGHDHAALEAVFKKHRDKTSNKPSAIIANTVKGKGVSWMENSLDWHYKSPSPEQLAAALIELDRV